MEEVVVIDNSESEAVADDGYGTAAVEVPEVDRVPDPYLDATAVVEVPVADRIPQPHPYLDDVDINDL